MREVAYLSLIFTFGPLYGFVGSTQNNFGFVGVRMKMQNMKNA